MSRPQRTKVVTDASSIDAVVGLKGSHHRELLGARLEARTWVPPTEALVDFLVAAGLTRREAQISAGLLRGCTRKEIAARLEVDVTTVHKHIEHIFHKLRVHTQLSAALALLALLHAEAGEEESPQPSYPSPRPVQLVLPTPETLRSGRGRTARIVTGPKTFVS